MGMLRVRREAMLNTIKAVIKDGKIELLEQIVIPEGTSILVTVLPEEDDFWYKASESSLASIGDNDADDVYEQLLDR